MKVGFGGKPCVKILEIRLNMANKKTEFRVPVLCCASKYERFRAKRYAEKARLIVVCLRRTTKMEKK